MSSSTARSLRSMTLRFAVVAALVGCNNPPAETPDACATCDIDAAVGDDAATEDAFVPQDTNSDAGNDASVPNDPHYAEREACTFARFAMPADTVGTATEIAAARGAIEHVIVIMQENRSFDHLFGVNTHGWDGFPAGFTNPDGAGGTVAPFHATSFCQTDHPPHQWNEMHSEWNNGAMDGFVTTGGMVTMSYYEEADHPFYTWILSTFATSDRYFASVLGGTWANRDYLYAGTSNGVMNTGMTGGPTVSIFDRMDLATPPVSWGDYVVSNPNHECLEGALGGTWDPPSAPTGFCARAGVHPYADLSPLLASGTGVPSVVFVDLEPTDDHPDNGDIRAGENAVHDLMMEIFASPIWPHTAVFFTYDEGGAFVDHVPPPTACLAASTQTAFDHLGMRVPVAVVSPYSRAGFNSQLTHSHTSILRFIETIWDLQALSGRDANSDAMLDMFDFSSASFSTVDPTSVVDAATLPATCP